MAARVGLDGRALGNINRNRGIGRYTARLIEALAAARDGFDLVVFGYGESPGPGLVDPAAIEAVEWHRVPGAGGGSIYGGPLAHFSFARAVRESGVSLFHGIDHNMSPFISCPSIVTVHDLIPLVLRGPYLGPKSWLWMRAHRAACRKASRVVAVSESTRNDVARIWKIPGDRIEVVPEGVSPRFSPVRGARLDEALARCGIREPYFLYIGGFDPRKNICNMLLGFKRFKRSGGEGTMVLCGDTCGSEDCLADEIEELGLNDSVLIPGFIGDEDLPALYSGSRALVLVSMYEGFGLPLLESMACGAPVLASNVSSIPGVVGDAAILVDPLDPDAIAGGLSSLAHDTPAREDLIEKGFARASAFTWDKAAAQIMELYRGVLGGAPR